MKCSENCYISLCEYRNILINKQNICEQNPFMNYCMMFHCNVHAGKHMLQKHPPTSIGAVRSGLL